MAKKKTETSAVPKKQEMKTTNIKGKEYVTVNERILYLRDNFPGFGIVTEITSQTDNCITMKASVINDKCVVVATGHAMEERSEDYKKVNFTSHVENCETSAVGRALGIYGIGIDKSVASADEVELAISRQEKHVVKVKPKVEEGEIEEAVIVKGGKQEGRCVVCGDRAEGHLNTLNGKFYCGECNVCEICDCDIKKGDGFEYEKDSWHCDNCAERICKEIEEEDCVDNAPDETQTRPCAVCGEEVAVGDEHDFDGECLCDEHWKEKHETPEPENSLDTMIKPKTKVTFNGTMIETNGVNAKQLGIMSEYYDENESQEKQVKHFLADKGVERLSLLTHEQAEAFIDLVNKPANKNHKIETARKEFWANAGKIIGKEKVESGLKKIFYELFGIQSMTKMTLEQWTSATGQIKRVIENGTQQDFIRLARERS